MTASGIFATISCIVGVIGIVIGVTGFFSGKQKQSNDDVEKQAYFRGEINTKIDLLMRGFEEIKAMLAQSISSVRDEINEKMEEHIRLYHNE